jgi:hypothetical protein
MNELFAKATTKKMKIATNLSKDKHSTRFVDSDPGRTIPL